ncbi:hypothetical protein SETIT_5G074300v2 [Setaria italica]|uniref:Reverse transcriptase zinc-binding domain-containing protein n=1 Tax=Setaria italica TaxID=4555 RepID=A0A368R294_SETIT|nr:hypothetical protein SETIT_5G074300v2 [Setaria italica]
MATPKKFGGAGFTNTREMNKCLLAKWIFKIERGDDSEKGFFSYHKQNGSQFWKGLLEARDSCARGLIYIIGNGKKARFWSDVWRGNCPLKIAFSELFEVCNQQEWSVFEVLQHGDINLTFRRNFGIREEIEWENLTNLIGNITLSETSDTVRWALEKSGDFSTPSLYTELTSQASRIDG